MRRLYDAYTALGRYDEGTFLVARRDKELGEVTSVASFVNVVDDLVNAGVRGLTMQRYKGLGEMNPDQLWDSTMDPESRTLLKVDIDDELTVDQVFQTLMGEEVAPRKSFIMAGAKMVKNLDI